MMNRGNCRNEIDDQLNGNGFADGGFPVICDGNNTMAVKSAVQLCQND